MKKKFDPREWQGRRKDQVDSNHMIANLSIGIISVILMGLALINILEATFRGILW